MSKAVRWYCGIGDEQMPVGCGVVLKLGRELVSPGAQYSFFEATCPKCGAEYEVWHNMEDENMGTELIKPGKLEEEI